MSTIPPNWLGSIIQTQGAQERATQAKNVEKAQQNGHDAFAEKLQDVIENSDRDGAVYADAEGSGSQGSPFSEPEEEQAPEETTDEPEPPAGGLDIEA